MTRRLLQLGWLALAGFLAGCAAVPPEPLSVGRRADSFLARSLSDEGLRLFLETNGVVSVWPREGWDLNALTLAALYYHPGMELARARWHSATAARVTAAQRPNPNLAFTPRVNSSSIGTGLTPWILGGMLDIPLETMGKRRHRTVQAEHLAEMARYDLAGAAWAVRNGVRTALLLLQGAQEEAALRREQADALGLVARLVEVQWEAGSLSPVEVSAARVAHQSARLSAKDVSRQEAAARGRLAEAIGLPLRAIEGLTLSFPDLSVFPTNLTAAAIQRQAVLNRADVLSALAEYDASESALQVQVAKQYPDIHLRPGYELDQNKNKWQLGISMDLPLLHRNQGPIGEAKARRREVAAKFDAVQARAIGEIDRFTAVYSAAVDQAATADAVVAGVERRRTAMTRRYEAGDVDRLAATSATAEYLDGALGRLRAHLQAQQALADLENAVQAPLLLPNPVAPIDAPVQNSTKARSP